MSRLQSEQDKFPSGQEYTMSTIRPHQIVHHYSGPGDYTTHFTALQTYLVHYTSLPLTTVHCTSFAALVDTALHQHNPLIPSRLTPSLALPGLHFSYPCFEFVRVTVSNPYRPFW
jgi:hypothetical protein